MNIAEEARRLIKRVDRGKVIFRLSPMVKDEVVTWNEKNFRRLGVTCLTPDEV